MMKRKFVCFVFVAIFTVAVALNVEDPCKSRSEKYGDVCVCNETFCDTLIIPRLKLKNEFLLVTSAKSGERFSYRFGSIVINDTCGKCVDSCSVRLNIDTNKKYQKIMGFGGAFTGSVSYNLQHLSPNLRKCVYKSFYSQAFGSGYSIIRIPIGGTDCDMEKWVYNELPKNDSSLSAMNKLDQHDIDRNNQITELMESSKNKNIRLLGCTWFSPSWMGDKLSWTNTTGNEIQTKYYQTWADYHLKWLNLMHNGGKSIWAISTGNEPIFGITVPIMSIVWNATQQAKWIAEHLGPTIKNSNCSHVEIHGFDDMRGSLMNYVNDFEKTNKKALDFMSALEVHGYFDGVSSPEILSDVQQKLSKPILYSETAYGGAAMGHPTGPVLGLWLRAENLTSTLITNLKHSMGGYIYWKLFLNATGGPNIFGGRQDAPIVVNDNFTEIYKQPLFYAMAHFAKFIPPGSVRISCEIDGFQHPSLEFAAFLQPKNKVTVILHNTDVVRKIEVNVVDPKKGKIRVHLEPKSINTVVYLAG